MDLERSVVNKICTKNGAETPVPSYRSRNLKTGSYGVIKIFNILLSQDFRSAAHRVWFVEKTTQLQTNDITDFRPRYTCGGQLLCDRVPWKYIHHTKS